MGIKFNHDATAINKKSAPASRFELPSNIQFEHNEQVDQMMQSRSETIIKALLEGRRLY